MERQHTSIYDTKKGLVVVGNDHHVVIGVFIEFPQSLKEAYLDVLDHLYDTQMKWVYGPVSEVPLQEISKALQSKEMKSYKVDLDSFRCYYGIWRCLNVPECPRNKIMMPLPPCSHLIPFVHSLWNSAKGGSDTITKLLWNCQACLTINNPQTVTTARMLLLFAVLVHRLHQVGTSSDFEKYCSLEHFRNAANARLSFHTSVGLITECFTKACNPFCKADNEVAPQQLSPQRKRTTRNAPVPHTTKQWGIPLKSGSTPTRGRPHSGKSTLHELRCQSCPGFPAQRMKKRFDKGKKWDGSYAPVENRCALCGMKTKTYCLGCNRTLCFNFDRTEKLKMMEAKLFSNDRSVVLKVPELFQMVWYVDKRVPNPIARTVRYDTESNVFEENFFTISCYHMVHSSQLDKFWEDHLEFMENSHSPFDDSIPKKLN